MDLKRSSIYLKDNFLKALSLTVSVFYAVRIEEDHSKRMRDYR